MMNEIVSEYTELGEAERAGLIRYIVSRALPGLQGRGRELIITCILDDNPISSVRRLVSALSLPGELDRYRDTLGEMTAIEALGLEISRVRGGWCG